MDTQKMKVQKLVPTEYNGKWGFIDAVTGKEVVPFIYDYAYAFSVGLALVRQNGWWGYVDKTGKEVIPCIFFLYSSPASVQVGSLVMVSQLWPRAFVSLVFTTTPQTVHF